MQKSQSSLASVELGRQTFLKLFVDLVRQGFLRSESETEILSVNNKIALGFNSSDFDNYLNKENSNLPVTFVKWTLSPET